jgi:hypothetical protein
MPRVAENAEVKKTLTKMVNCTKKYREVFRKSTRSHKKWMKLLSSDANMEKKTTNKAYAEYRKLSDKESDIRQKCDDISLDLDDMRPLVIKEETRQKINAAFEKFDKDAREWSSNKLSSPLENPKQSCCPKGSRRDKKTGNCISTKP